MKGVSPFTRRAALRGASKQAGKAGYYTYGARPITCQYFYLGNVSMIDYALISPEHEEAIISLLERTIKRTKEANERKRGKKKSDTEEL